MREPPFARRAVVRPGGAVSLYLQRFSVRCLCEHTFRIEMAYPAGNGRVRRADEGPDVPGLRDPLHSGGPQAKPQHRLDREFRRAHRRDVRRVVEATTAKKLWCAVQYHADQDLDELRVYWGSLLEVDPSIIRLQRKSNSGQLNGRRWRSRYGVLTVGVDDTLLRARFQAWIDRIREDWRLDSAARHGA
jgi:hypothetical protein